MSKLDAALPKPIMPNINQPIQTTINNNTNNQRQEMDELMANVLQRAQHYYENNTMPRESRLVDFPTFKGGNQDPYEWLEAFERACIANRIHGNRAVQLVGSYLKRTALTWYNRQNIHSWDNTYDPERAFTYLFKEYFCNLFRINQWKYQLRNRK